MAFINSNVVCLFRSELEQAIQKKMKYKFSHYVMFAKTYAMPAVGGQPAGKMFVNAEEELFLNVCAFHSDCPSPVLT